MSKILNAEKRGVTTCTFHPSSATIKKVLEIMNEEQYIGTATEVADRKGASLQINLIGTINKCGVIKPRHAITKDGYEKFEKRFLPAKGFGILIVSTNQGMMTHEKAKEKGLGGKLIAYCY